MEIPAVFVYGTLRPGECGDHFWRGAVEKIEGGILRGALLFNLGPYPMAIRGDGEIRGEILHLIPEKSAQTLRAFDRYEGALYTRERVKVQTQRGEVQAWVYFGKESAARRGRLIAGGDWQARFEKPI